MGEIYNEPKFCPFDIHSLRKEININPRKEENIKQKKEVNMATLKTQNHKTNNNDRVGETILLFNRVDV